MLQNDMGNTLIQDSATGHIMGLSEGFVPVGLKEAIYKIPPCSFIPRGIKPSLNPMILPVVLS